MPDAWRGIETRTVSRRTPALAAPEPGGLATNVGFGYGYGYGYGACLPAHRTHGSDVRAVSCRSPHA